MVDQLELIGSSERPLVIPYGHELVREVDTLPLGYQLDLHREDLALFLQAEVLNYLSYYTFYPNNTRELTHRAREAVASFFSW